MAQKDEPSKPEIKKTEEPEKPEEPTNDAAETQADEGVAERSLGDQEAVMKDDEPPKPPGKFKRFFAGYWRKKLWTVPLTLLVIIGIIFAVPATRYPVFGLWLKRSFAITIVDSKTDTPVSGAAITLGGQHATTDLAGRASVTVKVGKGELTVSKKYYKNFSENVFVGIKGQQFVHISLVATGRQVPIKVVNKINGQPIQNAEVKVLDTEAKTDSDGKAIIVLPTTAATQTATITASGYNDASANVQVTAKVVAGNTFSVTPSGRIYFLSNLSGNIDVVSTNLDGSGRQTILAGTGKEDPNNTTLLATTDWKYLVLLSKRDGGQNAKLFLINTSDDKVTTIDSSAASFNLIGWSGHYFVYEADPDNVKDWQNGQQQLKSYDADTGTTNLIDQTTSQGSIESDWLGQQFGTEYIMGNQVVYSVGWQGGVDNFETLQKMQASLITANVNGTNRQVIRTFGVTGGCQTEEVDLTTQIFAPNGIYVSSVCALGSGPYYKYQDGLLTVDSSVTSDDFDYDTNPITYLESPSGNQTFWAEPRDGENTLFVGDADGSNGKQIASLSNYTAYGWYTNNYLLVEENSSELYVMPVGGGKALKISDYYKPAQNFSGYGSGYGGL